MAGEEMAHKVIAVSGRAKKCGIAPGDELIKINGEVIVDALDYEALATTKDPLFTLRRQGREYTVRMKKGEWDDAGMTFETPLMSGTRMCCNHCLFCFVEQLPACARESLRVKDDDWRLSLMMGNYVTLTNLPPAGIDRIVRRHASPLYISVHAMEPSLRARIMGTERARELPAQLDALDKGHISYHCQAVLCPGINDGDALEYTISRLAERLPHALSLALVPVGLTGHREGLTPLHTYTKEEARAVLDIADRWREKLLREQGTRFVFPSDEFYILADRPLPEDEAYEEYGQIDDGVGMLRLLETEYNEAVQDYREDGIPAGTGKVTRATVACGVSAAPYLREMLKNCPVPDVRVEVLPVVNRYFGETVTVSGLLTGGDLLRALKDRDDDAFLITRTMLREEDDRFLDDMTLDELTQALGRPVIPTGRAGGDLLEALRRLPEIRR